jgi:prophage antirepressor-like protein
VKNKVEYVKWDRLKCYLKSINAKLIDRNGTLYIREADFYMLSMTVRNEKARNFQYQLAHSILPNLRKTGDEQPKLTANLENSKDFLDFIKEELSPDVYKKLLSEYKKQS